MSSTPTYLWIVEWDDRFVTPQRVEVRHITRLEGVSDDDIERHLVEVAIPAQAADATRVGHVTRQVLLRLSGPRKGTVGYANAGDGTASAVGDLAVSIGHNAEVVWRSREAGTDWREM